MTETEPPVALVTGSARRIGRTLALGLADDGFDLVLHYNGSTGDAEALKADVVSRGRRAVLIRQDLAEPEKVPAIIDAAVDALGPLSLLINNASVLAQDSLADMTMASWRHLIDVNLTSPVLLIQAFARQKALPKNAQIINLLDQQMSAPSPRFLSYSVAKTGLEGVTRLAAFDLAPDIRVNGIAPGLVLRSGSQTNERFLARQREQPLGEGLGANDILHAVRYLLKAAHVTGEVLLVDAGQHLVGPGNSRLLPREDKRARKA